MGFTFKPRNVLSKARKVGGEELVALTKFAQQHQKFLGTNKAGENYFRDLDNSMHRYIKKAEMRKNLFAICMPAGHGKSTLAKRYGLIDVDQLISEPEKDYYRAKRLAILAGKDTWSNHNNEWFARMNKTLDLLDYSRPVIIMVHHEEIAYELGAVILGAIKLDRAVFEANIIPRMDRADPSNYTFSVASYDGFRVSRYVENVFTAHSNAHLEEIVLNLINANDLPIAAPYKYNREYKNSHYANNVPEWLLRGERTGDDNVSIKLLVDMFEAHMIPKEAVDYYVRHSYTKTSFDFGISMYEWVDELRKFPPVMNERKKFDINGDMKSIFPPRSAKEMSRANVTVRRLIQTFDIFSHWEAVEIAEHHVGAPQVFVAGLLSHWKGICQESRVAGLVRPLYAVHWKHWTKRMKEIHSLIRTSRFFMNTEIFELERQSVMYMDLLIGRAEYVINEEAEIQKRSASGTYQTQHLSYDPHLRRYTNERYKLDFRHAVRLAYSRIRTNPKKINLQSFKDFYERRRTWVTKGGLVYNKLPSMMKKFSAQLYDSVYETISIIEGRHNKLSLFEVSDLQTILKGFSADDVARTKTMLKYETGGKERVLLPGSIAHFIIFTYILILAERQEQVGSVRLNAMADEDIRYFDRKMGFGFYHVLYDWADFNEQHSADEMAAVITELSEAMQAPTDYHMFVEAIAEGMYNMSIQDKEGIVWKIWNGLYSGWRGTTWINTVLNFVYLMIALTNIERIYGVSCVVMVDHGGDDVDLMLSEPTMLPKILEVMDAMLFNANAWKQMIGERSEFFRNTIVEHTVYASPTRALASFVAGDWEGSGQSTVRERVVSLLDQIAKMQRRGVSKEMCNGFIMCSISHWCKIKDGDEWLNLPDVILHGHPDDGGLGIPDINNQVWRLESTVPKVEEEWFKVIVPDYRASRDYVQVVAKELEKFSIVIKQREEIAKEFARASFDIEKRMDYESWRRLLNFNTSIKYKVNIIEPLRDDVLFEQFTSFTIDENVLGKYSQANRYLELVQYMRHNNKAITRSELVNIMSEGKVQLDALDFQGDVYYRRLIPDFMAFRITYYCKEALNQSLIRWETAEKIFKTLCYMSSQIFGHHM
jgi:hypothetical protein